MHNTHKKTHKNKYTKTHKNRSRIMKGRGLFEDMKIGFNDMQTKANGLWTSGTSKMKSMFSYNQAPYQAPYQAAANPVAQPPYQAVANPPYPVANPVANPVAQPPYQTAANQPFMGGMPAYNSYHDKSFSQVHGYQTAKPLTYVSGYGGGRNVRRGRKRRGGTPCSIADLPYSTMETGSSYANKLTGGKRRKNSRKTRKYRR